MFRLSRLAKALTVAAMLGGALLSVQGVLALPPQGDFSWAVSNPNPPGACKELTFTSSLTDPEDDVSAIEWDLDGNGSFEASGSTVAAAYGSVGTRNVTMHATDLDAAGDGIEELTVSHPVEVSSAPPSATIGVSADPQAGQQVNFSVQAPSDPDGTVAATAWDLDNDGAFDDGTGPTASRTYPGHGNRTVGLRVTDNCNVSTQVTTEFTLGNTAPQAGFTMTATVVNPGTAVTFNASATDSNGDTPAYAWDLDGNATSEFVPGTATAARTYTAAEAGRNMPVRLRVTDGHGGVAIVERELHVNKPPFPAFSVEPELPVVNEPVSFNALAADNPSSDYEGPIVSFEWDFDYAGTPASFTTDATGSLTSRVFTTAGRKSVALRLKDGDGGVTVFPRPVDVQQTQPSAGLTYSPQHPLPGQAVTLTSTSTPSASPSQPAVESTQWDFDYSPTAGFEAQASGATTVTSFATPGPHTVAVKATQTGGGADIETLTIVVNAPPQAAFTVSPAKPVEGQAVTLLSTAGDPDGPLAAQQWDLDNDGQFDDAQGAVVSTSKLKKGSRTVRLRVTDAKGATADAGQTLAVKAKPLKAPVDVKRSIGFARRKWGVELVVLVVKVPARTTVKVKCKGRGCPRGTLTKRSGKKAAKLRFGKLHGSVRAGAKITVASSRTGHITAYDTYLIRGNMKAPLLREQCKWGPHGKPRRCP